MRGWAPSSAGPGSAILEAGVFGQAHVAARRARRELRAGVCPFVPDARSVEPGIALAGGLGREVADFGTEGADGVAPGQ